MAAQLRRGRAGGAACIVRYVALLMAAGFAGIGAEPTVEELMARLTQSVLVDVEEPYQDPGQAHYHRGHHSDESVEEAVKARFVKKGGKPKKLRRVSDSASSGAAAMTQQLRSFRNGDGTMDAEGLRKAANLLGLGPEFTDDIDEHVRSTDWNGDGRISIEELRMPAGARGELDEEAIFEDMAEEVGGEGMAIEAAGGSPPAQWRPLQSGSQWLDRRMSPESFTAAGDPIVTVDSMAEGSGNCRKKGSGTCTFHAAFKACFRARGKDKLPLVKLPPERLSFSKAIPKIGRDLIVLGDGRRLDLGQYYTGHLPSGPEYAPTTIIDGRKRHRHFSVGAGAVVLLENLSLRRGHSEVGGSIHNEGIIQMVNVELLENSGDHGGAIYNEGSLKMYATTAKFCSSKFCGGVLYHATGGRADASGCTFEANTELGCVREKAERDASELPAQLGDGAAPTVSLQNTAFGEKLPPGYYDDYELLEAHGSDGKIRDASTGRENDVTGAIFHGPIIELQRGRKAPHEYHGPVAGLGGGGDDEEGDV